MPFPQTLSPRSPSVEYWNKKYLPSFSAAKRRPRRRSSLCYSESLDDQSPEPEHSLSNPNSKTDKIRGEVSQLPQSKLHTSFSEKQKNTSNISKPLKGRPSFTLCNSCDTKIRKESFNDESDAIFSISSTNSGLSDQSNFDHSSPLNPSSLSTLSSLSSYIGSSPSMLSLEHPPLSPKTSYPFSSIMPLSSIPVTYRKFNKSPSQTSFSPRTHTGNHHHAKESLLGSYEESLLSGRMSTPSSPPVPFYMKLSVFCQNMTNTPSKESLKFSKHITTKFNAVFYDYDLHETGIPGKGSPYVGTVDLEKFYVNQYLTSGRVSQEDILTSALHRKQKALSNNDSTLKLSRSKGKPQLPFPGYRIPPVGKIQIVISNPQKTAVKLFLVPYDASTLEYKQKTFIRHKVFIRSSLSSSQSRSSNSGSTSSDNGQRMSLLQTVHLQIARPFKNKYYLYGDLRVIFHNREESNFFENDSKSLGLMLALKDSSLSKIETITGGNNPLKYNIEKAFKQNIDSSHDKDQNKFDERLQNENWKFVTVFDDEEEDNDIDEINLNNESIKCDCCNKSIHSNFTRRSVSKVNEADDKNMKEKQPTYTEKSEDTDDDLSNFRQLNTREDLNERLMSDMEAASKRSYSHAPGIL